MPAAHGVVDKADVNAAPRLVDEGVAHQAAHGVVLDDIGLDMDALVRPPHLAQQRLHPVGAGGVAVDVAHGGQDGAVGGLKQPHQGDVAPRRGILRQGVDAL